MRRFKWIRNTAFILFFSSLSLALYEVFQYYTLRHELESAGQTSGSQSAEDITAKMDTILVQVMAKGKALAQILEDSSQWEQETLHRLLQKESKSLKNILGITAAFEPNVYPGKNLYAPYYDKNKDGFILLEEVYDYTDPALLTSQWYVQVKQEGAQWIEPYYAEGAQAMVADYGIPFYRSNPQTGEKEVAGTITMTISLAAFTRLMNSLSLGKTGYGFVISKEGKYLAHPIREYINNKNIFQIADEKKDPILRSAATMMTKGEAGHEEYFSQVTFQQSYLFYRPITASGWSLGIVLIKDEITGHSYSLEILSLRIFISFSLLAVLGLFIGLRLYYLRVQALWKFSVGVSSILLANVLFCWYIKLSKYTDEIGKEEVRITSNSGLEKFLSNQEKSLKELNLKAPTPIPTGIFIQELEVEDSYNVNISGFVWQKYPLELDSTWQIGLRFPQAAPFAEAVYFDKHYQERTRTHQLHRWEFRLSLRLNFDYSTYPFDRRKMAITLAPKDIHSPFVLTPDLEGYKLLSPSARPGINNKVVLPGFAIESSHYSYLTLDYNTNFGMEESFRPELNPELHFNIMVRRNFINAFVINFIPILVVALMLYLILYSSSKRISSVGVVESSAAFFFVLVLAHIDLRRSIQSDRITYMEFFYFIMYLILVLSAFNIILFTRRNKVLFFDYQDNLIVKLLYWPTFLGLSFLATLFTFF